MKANNIPYQLSYEKKNDKSVSLYSIFNGIVIIAVYNVNSKIFRITAKSGYENTLLNKIKIGDTLSDVIMKENSFYYNEIEDTFISSIYPGVSLDLEVTDYLMTNIENPKIENISVFAVEIITLQGQLGNW